MKLRMMLAAAAAVVVTAGMAQPAAAVTPPVPAGPSADAAIRTDTPTSAHSRAHVTDLDVLLFKSCLARHSGQRDAVNSWEDLPQVVNGCTIPGWYPHQWPMIDGHRDPSIPYEELVAIAESIDVNDGRAGCHIWPLTWIILGCA